MTTIDNNDLIEANNAIRFALNLIKMHITEKETTQNRELTYAVRVLVDEFRKVGRL